MLIAAAAGWAASVALCALHLRTRRRLVLVAHASHEVRGPLCAARLGLDTLAAEPARVAAIHRELARAGRALDDLTAAPSGGRAAERVELVDLAVLVATYASTWRRLAAAHGAGFALERTDPSDLPAPVTDRRPPSSRSLAAVPSSGHAAPPPTAVFADPLRIVQACANLVGNAAEHGGGVVRVRVRAAGDWVRIEVADDGAGLAAPVAALARTRVSRRGHGLAIALAIAERHGGRLTAAPSVAGARLALELPAAAPAALAPRRAVVPPPIVA